MQLMTVAKKQRTGIQAEIKSFVNHIFMKIIFHFHNLHFLIGSFIIFMGNFIF